MFKKINLFVLFMLLSNGLAKEDDILFYNSKIYGGNGGIEFEDPPSDGGNTHLMPSNGGLGGILHFWQVAKEEDL